MGQTYSFGVVSTLKAVQQKIIQHFWEEVQTLTSGRTGKKWKHEERDLRVNIFQRNIWECRNHHSYTWMTQQFFDDEARFCFSVALLTPSDYSGKFVLRNKTPKADLYNAMLQIKPHCLFLLLVKQNHQCLTCIIVGYLH